MNPEYFGSADAAVVSNDVPAISAFVINNIDPDHGRRLQGIENDIVLELEGSIGGLLNGRIALHQAGDFIKACPPPSRERGSGLPISLKLVNSRTNEVLASYSAVMEN